MIRIANFARFCLVLIALIVNSRAAQAQFTWTGAINNQWGTGNNWDSTFVPPVGSNVKFGAPNNTSVDLFGNRTVGILSLSATVPFKLSNDILKISTGVQTDGTIVGSHEIASGVDLPSVIPWNITGGAPLLVSGVIDGAGGITKQGLGELTLSAANTFTGDTTINAGKVVIDHADALANSMVVINIDNGLDINGLDAQIGALAGSGDINLGSQDLQVGYNDTSTTYAGVITGTSDSVLRNRGTGTLTLTGGTIATPSSFGTLRSQDGPVVVDGARIDLTSSDISFTSSALTLNDAPMTIRNGADVRVPTGLTYVQDTTLTLTGVGTLLETERFQTSALPATPVEVFVEVGATLVSHQGLSLETSATGTNTLFVRTGGTVQLAETLNLGGFAGSTGIASVSGTTSSLTAGGIRLGGNGNNPGGTGHFTAESGATVDIAEETKFWTAASTLTVDQATFATDTLTNEAGALGTIDISDPVGELALTVGTADGTSTFEGTIQDAAGGPGSLKKVGTGTFTLTGANTFTGGVVFEGGIVAVDADANLGDSSGPLTFDGGDLRFESSFDLSASRAITLNSGGGTIRTQSFNTTISQAITGVGDLTKEGGGNLTLGGANAFTGDTQINNGVVILANASALQNSTVHINDVNGLDVTTNAINANLGGLAGSGDLDLGSRVARVGSNGASTNYSGVISGTSTSALIFNGTGTITLSGGDMVTPSSFGALRTTTAGGHLVVDGAHIDLSFSGTGLLNNALDVVDSDMTLTNGGEIDLGTHAGLVSQGELSVTGAGTLLTGSRFDTLNNGNLIIEQNAMLDVSGTFYVSFFGGTSEATVRTGGMTSVNSLVVGVVASDNGTVLVQDQTSVLSANRINLGGSSLSSGAGTGVLIVEGGATVEAAVHTALITSASSITVNGGSLLTNTLRNRTGVTGTVSISDPVGDAALTVGTNDGTSTFDGLIQDAAAGPGSLKKVGTGTFTLTNANTYSGDTIIEEGTLSIQNAYLSDTANVSILTGGTFHLNFMGIDTIDELFISGLSKQIGTHGAIGSGADFEWPLFTGMGLLEVSTFSGIPGDFDADGDVDGRDFVIWQRNPAIGNLTDWQTNYGMVAPLPAASTAVPEPTSLLLVFAGALCCGCRRRFAS